MTLTIAGSDSGGGAGIQADLKVFNALGCFGTTAVTCVTAQNPSGIRAVAALSTQLVERQVDAVCGAFRVAAAKTGMLYSAQIIRAVARAVARNRIRVLVVDPVLKATSGRALLAANAVAALKSRLLPKATLVTPNVPEAELLAGRAIADVNDMKAAARHIGETYGTACVIKGGHLPRAASGGGVFNVLYERNRITVYESERLRVAETHGGGCAFSSAVTAYLAQGCDLSEAVALAGIFVARAMKHPLRVGKHRPINLAGEYSLALETRNGGGPPSPGRGRMRLE